MSIVENLKIIKLIDIYGQLLTDKQLGIMTDYYFDNLSLSEIGENRNISRQAVSDCLTQSLKTLNVYEEKIGMLALKGNLKESLTNLKNTNSLDNLTQKIDEILENLD